MKVRTAIIACAGLLAVTSPGAAERDEIESLLAACAQTASAAARIACLEDALADAYGVSTASASDSDARSESEPAAVVEDHGPAIDDPAPSVAEAAVAEDARAPAADGARRFGLPRIFGQDVERREVPSSDPEAERFGSEQVSARDAAKRDAESLRMSGRVVSSREVPYRRLEVELDNGQVWRQIQGDNQRIRIPDAELSVEIWESRLGGYQMRLHELGRTLRVERLQ